MNQFLDKLGDVLRSARATKKWSQLELASRLGISQRHLSFVEGGRARPSRELLHAWLNCLELQLSAKNEAMLYAGYALPHDEFMTGSLNIDTLAHASKLLLTHHDPLPAVVMDAQWNILFMNQGYQWLARQLIPSFSKLAVNDRLNALDLMLGPDGYAEAVLNLDEVGPALLSLLMKDSTTCPALLSQAAKLSDLLLRRVGVLSAPNSTSRPTSSAVPIILATPFGKVSLMIVFTTLGTSWNVTMASPRVEQMFAADQETYALFSRHVERVPYLVEPELNVWPSSTRLASF